jgi:hypothetical protein
VGHHTTTAIRYQTMSIAGAPDRGGNCSGIKGGKNAQANMAVAITFVVTPALAQANAEFRRMIADTGCDNRYSDDKRADLFTTQYRGKPMTVTGEIATVSSGNVSLRVLPGTRTFDIRIDLRDSRAAYDLERASASS